MGFPRDYLEFTIWYLFKKGYITKGDNAEFTLTADGVDFVETQRISAPVLNKLLTSGADPSKVATVNEPGLEVAVKPAVTPTERRGRRKERRAKSERRKRPS
jgi:hypothetical protein